MKIILHQIKKEWLSQRWGFCTWYALLGIELLVVGSGFFGAFYKANHHPIGGDLSRFITVLIAIGTVLIPAALALADPPLKETASWRVLPVRSHHLLLAKLLTIVFFLLIPLCVTQLAALWLSDATMWSSAAMLNLLSSYPAWMLLGFGFGSATGSWRQFSIVMTLFLSSWMLVEGPLSLGRLEDSVRNCFENSVFLLGSVIIIVLRFFTRFHGLVLSCSFLLSVPWTVYFLPVCVRGYVPNYHTESMLTDKRITVDYAIPTQMVTYENQNKAKLKGLSPYSALRIDGSDAEHFLIPYRLDSVLNVLPHSNPSEKKHFGFRYRFVPWNWSSFGQRIITEDLDHERIFALPNLMPEMTVINPVDSSQLEFDIFDLDENALPFIRESLVDLSTHWWLQPFRFEHLGDLALESGSALSTNGATLRLVAWLPDAEDRTQIKLHIRTVDFASTRHARRDPRLRVESLRFVLVNEQAGEVCSTTMLSRFLKEHEWCRVGFHSVIFNYSVADSQGSEGSAPVAIDWLENAKVRVFRFIPGTQIKVGHYMEDVRITDLPIHPRLESADATSW